MVERATGLLPSRRLRRLAGTATALHGFSFGSTKARCRSRSIVAASATNQKRALVAFDAKSSRSDWAVAAADTRLRRGAGSTQMLPLRTSGSLSLLAQSSSGAVGLRCDTETRPEGTTVTGSSDTGYQLGSDAAELERLDLQGRVLAPATRKILETVGLGSGMRVLDLGSGAGDVAFVAAELVGSAGEVVGLDQSPESVAKATLRAEVRGLPNVRFVVGDVHDQASDGPYDAIVRAAGFYVGARSLSGAEDAGCLVARLRRRCADRVRSSQRPLAAFDAARRSGSVMASRGVHSCRH